MQVQLKNLCKIGLKAVKKAEGIAETLAASNADIGAIMEDSAWLPGPCALAMWPQIKKQQRASSSVSFWPILTMLLLKRLLGTRHYECIYSNGSQTISALF